MTSATSSLPQSRRLPLPRLSGLWKAIRQHPSGAIGLFGVTFFLLMALIGPLVVPLPKVNVEARSQPPSFEHILGTDNQGKDIAAQIVHGSRPVITVAVLTGLITTGIAITLGALSAFWGGLFDRVVNSAANFVLTIPYLVAMTVLASFIRLNSPITQALILSLWS
ncbi:MAG: ABC transporter permease, partial [Aggregatilineales bacterium]